MLGCLVLVSCTSTGTVCIGERCWVAEIAQTQQQREQGLMNRYYLPEDTGMLFVFDESGPYTFWMKDTYIVLDIIWILNDTVVHIERNVPTCATQTQCPTYRPTQSANYVFEVHGGQAQDVRVGDLVSITKP